MRWPVLTTSSPPWICSIRSYASRFWWPTRHLDEPGSRCWRPSVSSPGSNLSRPVGAIRRAAHTPDTSPVGVPMSWRCGTGPANGKPTNGWLSSSRICAVHSGGPQTATTSTPPPTSSATQGFSASGMNSTNPWVGPRNSSMPRGLSTTGVCRRSTWWRRCAMRAEGSTTPSAMPKPAGRPSKANISTRCHTSSESHSAVPMPRRESPMSGLSCAATSSDENRPIMALPRHSWSWD
ncbi:hypothetical protein ACVWWN_008401 [Mycobacterium sp. URHB0021]